MYPLPGRASGEIRRQMFACRRSRTRSAGSQPSQRSPQEVVARLRIVLSLLRARCADSKSAGGFPGGLLRGVAMPWSRWRRRSPPLAMSADAPGSVDSGELPAPALSVCPAGLRWGAHVAGGTAVSSRAGPGHRQMNAARSPEVVKAPWSSMAACTCWRTSSTISSQGRVVSSW
jgi:hypothetical protein